MKAVIPMDKTVVIIIVTLVVMMFLAMIYMDRLQDVPGFGLW